MTTSVLIAIKQGLLFGVCWVVLFSPLFIVLAWNDYLLPSLVGALFLLLFTGVPLGIGIGCIDAYTRNYYKALPISPAGELRVFQSVATYAVGLIGSGAVSA